MYQSSLSSSSSCYQLKLILKLVLLMLLLKWSDCHMCHNNNNEQFYRTAWVRQHQKWSILHSSVLQSANQSVSLFDLQTFHISSSASFQVLGLTPLTAHYMHFCVSLQRQQIYRCITWKLFILQLAVVHDFELTVNAVNTMLISSNCQGDWLYSLSCTVQITVSILTTVETMHPALVRRIHHSTINKNKLESHSVECIPLPRLLLEQNAYC